MTRRYKTSIAHLHKFTREMLTEFEETFSQVCNEEERMPTEKMTVVLQALGLEVSKSFYEDLLEPSTVPIDFDKFLSVLTVCIEQSSHWMHDEIQETFNIFDKDQDGSLDSAELKRVFTKLGEGLSDKDLADQIKDFDVDHDGEMAIAEYVLMVHSTRGLDFNFDN